MGLPSVALIYLVPVSILTGFAVGLCALRMYTRVKTRKFYIDDWLILAAVVLGVIDFGLRCGAFGHGWGRPLAAFTPAEKEMTLKLRFAATTIWMVNIGIVRLSIACSLLRYGEEKLWRWPLYIIIVFQILISTGYFIAQFIQCRPMAVSWRTVPGAKCWPIKPQVIYGWIVCGLYIAIDLILALMPVRFIRTLNRPTMERFLIGVLMATGLLATGALGAKLSTMKTFGKGDPMVASIRLVMWTKVEELLGIIAACLPTLKSLAERGLRRAGMLTTHFHNTKPSFVVSLHTRSGQDGQKDKDQESSNDGSSMRPDTDDRRSRFDKGNFDPKSGAWNESLESV